jgi:hypothetical protein
MTQTVAAPHVSTITSGKRSHQDSNYKGYDIADGLLLVAALDSVLLLLQCFNLC